MSNLLQVILVNQVGIATESGSGTLRAKREWRLKALLFYLFSEGEKDKNEKDKHFFLPRHFLPFLQILSMIVFINIVECISNFCTSFFLYIVVSERCVSKGSHFITFTFVVWLCWLYFWIYELEVVISS